MDTTRVTRARAAKSATAPTSSTAARAKATAAAKARAAATTSTSSTTSTAAAGSKRKTRTDDTEHEDAPVAKTRVGRPKKDASATASAAATAALGSFAEANKENAPASKAIAKSSTATVSAPTTATLVARGRPKKAVAEPAKAPRGGRLAVQKTPDKADEGKQATKPTRPRTGTAPSSSSALEKVAGSAPMPEASPAPDPAPAAKSGPKKTVTFLSPEKENLDPVVPAKAKNAATSSTANMRGRPARKAGTSTAPASTKTAGRATRTAKTAPTPDTDEKTLPLSPKKVTQMPIAPMDTSEDELALPDNPPKGILKRAPRRPISGTPKKVVAEVYENDDVGSWGDDSDADNIEEDVQPAAATMSSPAKRIGPSPYQDAMKSSARRGGGIQFDFTAASSEKGCESSTKTNFMQTPAKRPTSPIRIFSGSAAREQQDPQGFVTSSMFSSPAKRPVSAIKQRATPARVVSEPINESPEAKPTTKSTSSLFSKLVPLKAIQAELDAESESMQDADGEPDDSIFDEQSPTALKFPGRLSSILARHDDPIISAGTVVLGESTDAMVLDVDMRLKSEEAGAEKDANDADSKRTLKSMKFFGLRQKDLDPHHDDDSEDEEAATSNQSFLSDPIFARLLATPTPGSNKIKTPKSAAAPMQNALARQLHAPKLGFTPLVKQLNSWTSGSPDKDPKPDQTEQSQSEQTASPSPKRNLETYTPQSNASTPSRPHHFDEAMASTEAEMLAAIEAEISAKYDAFGDVVITDEDMDLAAEAREMSLLEPEEIERIISHQQEQAHEDDVLGSSQDYGDENRIPIDPALASGRRSVGVPVVTPQRALTRTVHTVSKVPLKSADDATPSPVRKRSASVSRLQKSRPAMHNRNATVISYTPTKADADIEMHQGQGESPQDVTWSSHAATPARTPRRHIDDSLLRGAIVYVDVRTSEGADASNIFVDLLTQMGAKCVKTWAWNPSAATGADGGKIGITHVVFKDGTKRTLEKVRESGGVVQCVGVSWVLDCEKQDEWLEETPYYIDSAPRDAPRRRKSMEPKVLSNLNGTLILSPVRNGHGASSQTAPNTPMNRRDSSIWQLQPSCADDSDHVVNGHDDTWDNGFLTPVPATPAPDAIARYAAQIAPHDAEDMASEDGFSPDDTSMLKTPAPAGMRTCPPKQGFREMLNGAKDEGVVMRLIAARRKSLQFAPKIGSPLARSWK